MQADLGEREVIVCMCVYMNTHSKVGQVPMR